MSKNENGSSFEVLQEVFKLARDIDAKMGELKTALSQVEEHAEFNSEEIKQLEKELDKALIRWQGLWESYRNYLIVLALFSFSVGMLALGFDKSMELIGRIYKAIF
jgi:hypothetical protein